MPTVKQTELINELLSKLKEEDRLFCEPVIEELLKLQYVPKKHKKRNFAIEFEKYGRIIMKFEVEDDGLFKFHMRYSACVSYPERFVQAAMCRPAAWVKRGQYYENHDIRNCCGQCNNNPRLYHVVQDNGTVVDTCGGFTKYIPGISAGDVADVVGMLREEDAYFNETFA